MTDYHQREPVTHSRRPLWAPWRIEYIRHNDKDQGCFLCQAPQDDTDENLIIARGENSFLMLNAFPYNSGHALVAPYEHVPDLSDLSRTVREEIMEFIVEIRNVIASVMYPDGFNVGFNLGSAAGAGVEEHVHGHIVPRWNGDTNFMPVLDDTRVVPEALKDTAELLRKAWEANQ